MYAHESISQDYNKFSEALSGELDSIKIKSLYHKIFSKSMLFKDIYKMPIKPIESRWLGNRQQEKDINLTDLLKLHGSINWYYSNDLSANSDIYYDSPDRIDLNNKHNLLDYSKEYSYPQQCKEINKIIENLKADLTPLIIPPCLDKSIFYSHKILQGLWHRAGVYLQKANEIYIIGYSLPLTDLAVNFLLQSNIKESAKIYVINYNKNREEMLSKYQNVFPKNTIVDDYCQDNNIDVMKLFIEKEIIELYKDPEINSG